jgi:hypothetical protein
MIQQQEEEGILSEKAEKAKKILLQVKDNFVKITKKYCNR